MDEHLRHAIIIDTWSTACGNCKAKVTPESTACETCNTPFLHVTTRYMGLDKAVSATRPDLTFVAYQRKETNG